MSTINITSKPSSEKGVKGVFKRLTTKLKRKHKGDEVKESPNAVNPHGEVVVPVEQGHDHSDNAKMHMQNMLGTADIDDDEVNKAKTYSEDADGKGKPKKNKKKVEHLLRRSRKYELTKSASRGDLEAIEADDHHAKAKEQDSDANIQAVEENGSSIKKTKEEKKREKKERKEKRKSRRKSKAATSEQAAEALVGQNDPVPMTVATPVVVAPEIIPATGRPSNAGFIRPLSCPPQRFNGELSTYGLRAIADAIQDVASSIAPELQPRTPQMTLADFVEGELQHTQVEQVKKPNLPSFDLPPPPSPPRNVRIPNHKNSNSSDAIDAAAQKPTNRRISLAGVSQEELAVIASGRMQFRSPLTSVSSPFASTSAAADLPQFTAQPSAASDTNERVKVTSKGRSGSKRTKRTSTGPVPTFTLFASSEPVKVPLLPIILPSGSSSPVLHKRKGAEHDSELPTDDCSVIDAAPEPKYPRLEEQQEDESLEKADTEAEFEAVPEVVGQVEDGRRICIEEQKSKRRPSIRPDEIKSLQEEEQQLMHHGDEQATGGEVTIYVSEGSPSSVEPSPEVEHNSQHALESSQSVDERPSAPEAQRAEEEAQREESDPQHEEALDDQESKEELAGGLGSQQSRTGQPQHNKGSRRNRRGGKNRTLRKQGTKSRLTYR